jgi:cardiolipin synthase
MIGHYWGAACVLFVGACMTDLFDGYLARKLNQRTFLGACLDPIADKILILSVFFTLAFVQSPLFAIPHWFVWIVLFKELLLVGGAFFVYLINGHIEIRPRLLGKITTVAQMSFIIWLFACYFFQWLPNKTYITMLGVLLLLVFTSLMHYMLIGITWLEGTDS